MVDWMAIRSLELQTSLSPNTTAVASSNKLGACPTGSAIFLTLAFALGKFFDWVALVGASQVAPQPLFRHPFKAPAIIHKDNSASVVRNDTSTLPHELTPCSNGIAIGLSQTMLLVLLKDITKTIAKV